MKGTCPMKELIHDMPECLRPYEKAYGQGAETLDDAELLAVILRSGTRGKSSVSLAGDVLKKAGGTLSGLYDLSVKELKEIGGIGDVKALELKCIAELSKRIARSKAAFRPDFSDAAYIAAAYMEDMRHRDQEVLKLLLLDVRFRLIGEQDISKGSVSESMVPVREILITAIKAGAVNMVLIHNHPSGDPTPSGADIAATETVMNAGRLTGILLADHIIIGDGVYVSLREKGFIA